MKKETFLINAQDGMDLFIYRWLPTDANCKAIVQISHGMAEHAGRYEEFAYKLTMEGYGVYANDHRGHGKTIKNSADMGYFAPQKGWDLVVEDMYILTKHIKEEWEGCPIFLFGHSMGSLLSRQYIYQYEDALKGVILSGTSGDPGILGSVGKVLASLEGKIKGKKTKSPRLDKLTFGSYNKAFKPSRTSFDWLSRDQMEVDKYVNDPLCGKVFTNGFFYDLLTGLKQINKGENIREIPKGLPIFFISGEKDPVGNDTKGVLDVYNNYKRIGIKDVEYKFYKDARHELLNELNKEQVMLDIIDWLNRKMR